MFIDKIKSNYIIELPKDIKEKQYNDIVHYFNTELYINTDGFPLFSSLDSEYPVDEAVSIRGIVSSTITCTAFISLFEASKIPSSNVVKLSETLGYVYEELNNKASKYLQHTTYKAKDGEIVLPSYYNNDKGSLYKVSNERGWSTYLFDIVKRLERGGKKDPLRQEIIKSIGVLELWLKELPEEVK